MTNAPVAWSAKVFLGMLLMEDLESLAQELTKTND
jgi:hypothetical protein